MIATLSPPESPLQPSVVPPLMTVAEFGRIYGGESHIELVKGQVKRKPMPTPKHGRTCTLVSRFLDQFVEEKGLGRVVSNDSFVEVRTTPDSVRAPDVGYYSFERLPKGEMPDGYLPCQPELVFEIKSKTNTWPYLLEKVAEFHNSDVLVVVILDTVNRNAKIYRPGGQEELVPADGTFTIPDVLPGFEIKLSRFFD